MSSPYAKFANRQSQKSTLRNIATLEKGKCYEVTLFDSVVSRFQKKGKEVSNLRAYYSDNGLKFFSYLPADFDDPEKEMIDAMNNDVKTGKAPFICYYGKLGSGNMLKIHPHGESVDEGLLQTLASMEDTPSPTKRMSESFEEPSPKRIPKLEFLD